ncbi:DUF3180 domain-containing protein [Arthrobacter sp. KK5.5]|uniref:DUF3180 domain-containing protein n=1 Tax=Arthrobacter sp. KK5.5 TaxID=3373084 RepID=UPI003EE5B04C
MSTIRPLWLLAICLGAALAGWIGQWLASTNGLPAPVLHWTSLITMGAGILITLGFGLRVRRYQQGKLRRMLDPLQAARTLVLAQATAYAGALIAGWHLGILVDLMAASGLRTGSSTSSLVMMGAAVAMVIVGWAVEQFCKLPPDDPSAPDANARDSEENEGYAPGTS